MTVTKEIHFTETRCPKCAWERVTDLLEQQDGFDRTIAALRGAITKLKKIKL